MDKINVNKEQLIDKLKENRAKHRGIFLEATDAYRKMAIAELDKSLELAKAGKKIRRSIDLMEPSDHTKDYDRAIGMLEMSQDTDIQLSERDYNSYVLDDWAWRQQFLYSNSSYSATASADYIELMGEQE